MTCPNWRITENARVFGKAVVCEYARVSGNAVVGGNARVSGYARVSGNAVVGGNARVSGNAEVEGNAHINGHVRIFAHAWIGGEAEIHSYKDWGFIDLDITVYRSRHAERYEIRNSKGELISLEMLSDYQLTQFFDWLI
jgi:UDP-3-O-[3-hydroxymyristoyl] glucosamine N-acyltransferase